MVGTAVNLSADQVADVLQAACRAPSLHNTQPWKFQVDGGSISVLLDSSRLLPATDPDGRECRISCGATLFNIKTALAGMGFAAQVDLNPQPKHGHLATVTVTGRRAPTERDQQLSLAIWRRATNRRPFSETVISADILRSLQNAATAEDTALAIIGSPSLHHNIRELSNEALQIQQSDPAWLAEWQAWTARDNTPDGVPITASGLPPAVNDLWALRDFGSADRPARIPEKDYEHEPVIAVLSTWDDLPVSQVRAGMGLQHVLLTATTHGISASFLSQVIEVAPARVALRKLLNTNNEPQSMMRLGYGTPVAPTPRRSFRECLDETV